MRLILLEAISTGLAGFVCGWLAAELRQRWTRKAYEKGKADGSADEKKKYMGGFR